MMSSVSRPRSRSRSPSNNANANANLQDSADLDQPATGPSPIITTIGAVRVAHHNPTTQEPSHTTFHAAQQSAPSPPVVENGQDQEADDDDDEDEDDGEEQEQPVQLTTVDGGDGTPVDESQFLADIADDVPELDMTHCRLENMSLLGLERFHSLQRLGMRQNLFTKIQGVAGLAPTLVELDLYDNRISKFDPVAPLINLELLDLSFNKIKRIPEGVLHGMAKLRDLYFVANKISVIENLDGLDSLRSLELGANRIRVRLTLLYLPMILCRKSQTLTTCPRSSNSGSGKNKITSLAGLAALPSLTLLSIQSNRIVDLAGLEALVNLEELYMSHNGVLKIDHLHNNTKLRVLDLCNNRIEKLENVGHLVELEELWISNNKLESWEDVEQQTKTLPKLETIYLEGNPLQRSAGATYRIKVKTLVPQVKQIDATFVRM
ncbi:hypothetical protein BCR44DRAFT_1437068 [Catenaria anguillulae PL171]|uniref:Protein phosphatase 1 regulatory subunit 7 n=1 Tax=Catenaria anguillulae PL171 TaxID=765915 RepID=A0A1Y2HHQ5_9FUNG|nr:hypothetical protein BCR44DRAFT_1437068 [Catenaria anguillulae PL171]